MQLPVDRLAIRAHMREQLRNHGLLQFAEDENNRYRYASLTFKDVAQQWAQEAETLQSVKLEGIAATTTVSDTSTSLVTSNRQRAMSSGAARGGHGLPKLPRKLHVEKVRPTNISCFPTCPACTAASPPHPIPCPPAMPPTPLVPYSSSSACQDHPGQGIGA